MKPEKYTPQQMMDAIRDADGILVVACRALGCHPTTFYRYCEQYPEVQAAYDEAKTKTDRAVENELMDIAFNKAHKDQLSALKYYTACKMGWRVGTDVTSAGEKIGFLKWSDE